MERNDNTTSVLKLGRVVVGILNNALTGSEYSLPDGIDFENLYKFCEAHKVTSLVAPFLTKCDGVPSEVRLRFQKQLFRCAARYTAQERERLELTEMFTRAGIEHCFLKGSKVSRFYPEPELRFMLDMDIYINPQKFDEAQKLMLDRGYEVVSAEDDKDIALSKKPFLNIDLHKQLKYDYDKGFDYYKGAFSRMQRVEGTTATDMTNEDFYVYILSHTAHHFETAGTGIRSVVDHYCVAKGLKDLCDGKTLDDSLRATGLHKFNERIDALCEYWFGDGSADPSVEELSQYIILSGVYGTQANTYMSGVGRGEYGTSKGSYLKNRVFMPYKKMCVKYRVLKKLPFLLPFFWLVRIVSAVFGKAEYKAEIESLNSTSADEVKNHLVFLKNNGL